jgi:hypothetical protein
MGGMQMVINTTFDGTAEDETMGVGFRYSGRGYMAYFDWVDMATGATTSESATKVGGKFKAGSVTIGVQFESAEDLDGANYTFVSAKYGMDKNNSVALSVGTRAVKTVTASDDDSSSFAILYNHKMGKKTNVYVGYGDRSDDLAGSPGVSNTTFGIRKKF